MGPQGEIRATDQDVNALQKHCVSHLTNKNKNNGRSITGKSNEATEYPDTSTCKQHGCRSHKTRVLLAHNQMLSPRITSDVIVDPNTQIHFRLDAIN